MEKMLWTATLIGLVFLAAAQFCFVRLAYANPIAFHIEVSPPVNPIISILSPAENNTVHNSNNLTISYNATIDQEIAHITSVQYKTSWQPNNITVWQLSYYPTVHVQPVIPDIYTPNMPGRYTVTRGWVFRPGYVCNLSLTGIPEGNQTMTITVHGRGYYVEDMTLCYFSTVSYCTFGFMVDTVPPKVSVLELDNETFIEPEVPLSFTANEPVSQVSYSLDGQENVTIAGNTTLTNLSYGEHNVTVYATDNAGNIGASKAITFTIAEPQPEPFPTTMFIAPIASVAIIGSGLLVYFKKRKKESGKKA